MLPFALFVIAVGPTPPACSPAPVRYAFTYDSAATDASGAPRPTMHVRLTLRTGSGRTTKLALPDSYGGNDSLFTGIDSIVPLSPGVRSPRTPIQRRARCRHRVHNRNHRIQSDPAMERQGHACHVPRARTATWMVSIVRAGIHHRARHLVGRARRHTRLERLSAQLVASQQLWKHAALQRIHRPTREIVGALYSAGDFRLNRIVIDGAPVVVAVRGSGYPYSDSVFAESLRRIIAAERGFWGEKPDPYYLVTLTPSANSGEAGGTGATDAFAIVADTAIGLVTGYTGLIAHEMMHKWIGGGALRPPSSAAENEFAWLTEGFTDYYRTRARHAGGILTDSAFALEVNAMLRDYEMSPLRNAPYSDIARDFWKSANAKQAPYTRGSLLAYRLNYLIRQATGGKRSLDDAMRIMLANAKLHPASISDESLVNAVASVAPSLRDQVRAEITREVRGGETIPVDSTLLGRCYTMTTRPFKRFEPGFDLTASIRAKTITGVDSTSAAYAAGVRDGMQLRRTDVHRDPARKSTLVLADSAGTERTVSYFPASASEFPTPVFGVSRAARPSLDDQPIVAGSMPRLANIRATVSAILLFGVLAPAVIPTAQVPTPEATPRVAASSRPWLTRCRITRVSGSMHDASSM